MRRANPKWTNPMPKPVQGYLASDGRFFPDPALAEMHDARLALRSAMTQLKIKPDAVEQMIEAAFLYFVRYINALQTLKTPIGASTQPRVETPTQVDDGEDFDSESQVQEYDDSTEDELSDAQSDGHPKRDQLRERLDAADAILANGGRVPRPSGRISNGLPDDVAGELQLALGGGKPVPNIRRGGKPAPVRNKRKGNGARSGKRNARSVRSRPRVAVDPPSET